MKKSTLVLFFGFAFGLLLLGNSWQVFSQIPTVGKTMMVPYIDKSGRDVVLVWFTDTGKSIFYYWNTDTSNWATYKVNIPAVPLTGIKGSVMMSPYIDKGGRDVVLVWDNASGKSIFYFWDTDTEGWKAYKINIPAVPISGSKGTIMMNPYMDNSGRDVVLVWDTVSGKSIFYTWNGEIQNWKTFTTNLPAVPIKN